MRLRNPIQPSVALADTLGVSALAVVALSVMLALTLVVLIVDVAVVNPRCCRTIATWATAHCYTLDKVRRQWVGRDVVLRADGGVRDVHSRPGGRYFVVTGTASSGMRMEGRLRVEGGFQGYGAQQVVELVVHELDFGTSIGRPTQSS